MADRPNKPARKAVNPTLVLAGDSRLQNLYPQSGSGISITSAGLVATVNLVSHGLTKIGQEVSLSGSPDDALNGVFGVTSIITPDKFTVTLDQVPTNPNGGPQTQVARAIGWCNHGILTWLSFFAGWSPTLLSNQAVGGYTTAQIAARAQKVAAYRAGTVVFNGGINDPISMTPQESVANLIKFADAQLAVDSIVIYIADMTVSSGYGNLSVGATQRIVERNFLMQSYCERTPNTIFFAADGITVNAFDPNGYGQAAMTGDGLHQSPTAAQLIGQGGAAQVRNLVTPNINLVRNPIDSRRVNPTSRNVIGNPLMLLGVGGSLQPNFTGQVPADWLGKGTNATGIGALVARTLTLNGDTCGNTFRADFTQGIVANNVQTVAAGATGSGILASFVSPAGFFGPGDTLRPELEISASNLINVANIYIQLWVQVGGQNYTTTWGSRGPGAYPQNAFKGPLRVPSIFIPPGAITACQLSIGVDFSPFVPATPGTARIEIARAATLKI